MVHTSPSKLTARPQAPIQQRQKEQSLLALGLAVMVGLSRVLLGVHYPSDILAGATLGVSCATLGLWLV